MKFSLKQLILFVTISAVVVGILSYAFNMVMVERQRAIQAMMEAQESRKLAEEQAVLAQQMALTAEAALANQYKLSQSDQYSFLHWNVKSGGNDPVVIAEQLIELGPHSAECVLFVRDALRRAVDSWRVGEGRHTDAVGVCRALLELSVDTYGARGKDVLINWGLRTSEDVGIVVFRMIDASLVAKSPRDSLVDFMNLFDLESNPGTWALQW